MDILYLVDVVISCVLHTPLTVMFWRGAWHLQDLYIVPDQRLYNHWISCGMGLIINLILYLTQDYQKKFLPTLSPIPYFIVSRFYIFVFGIGVVSHWRGVWLLLDYYSKVAWFSVSITTAVGVKVLLILRSFRNSLATPVLVCFDCFKHSLFTTTTRFQCDKQESLALYVLDTVFTVTVIHTLVVVVWRGFWELLDLGLYPDDFRLTTVYSILIGYSLMIFVVLIQSHVAKLIRKLTKNKWFILSLIVEDAQVIVMSFISVVCWRGFWYLQDLFLFDFNLALSYWVSLGAGTLGLIMLGTLNSVVTRGCEIDGAVPNGQGGVCDVAYFSRIYYEETQNLDVDKEHC